MFWKLKEVAKDIDWTVFATMAWRIWNNHNLYKHEGKNKPAKTIVYEAIRYAEEFKQGITPITVTPKQPPRVGSQWRPPKFG